MIQIIEDTAKVLEGSGKGRRRTTMSICPLELQGREGPADRRLGELLRILALAIGLAALLLGRWLAPVPGPSETGLALEALPWIALGLPVGMKSVICVSH
jgi:hypothetical protein